MTGKRPKAQFRQNSLYRAGSLRRGELLLCATDGGMVGYSAREQSGQGPDLAEVSITPLAAECLFNPPSSLRCLPRRMTGHRLRDPGSEQVISLGTHGLAAQRDPEGSFVSSQCGPSPMSPWRDATT